MMKAGDLFGINKNYYKQRNEIKKLNKTEKKAT